MFAELAAGYSVLAAVSISGELFTCGESVPFQEDEWAHESAWLGTLSAVGTPARVRSVLATRDSSTDYFWDLEGGSWRPNFDRDEGEDAPVMPTADEIQIAGLLALLVDGTVFVALQPAPVPGLRGVVSMYECGCAVAFVGRDAQLVVREW